LQILVRDNNVDQALRVLKKKMQREGLFRSAQEEAAGGESGRAATGGGGPHATAAEVLAGGGVLGRAIVPEPPHWEQLTTLNQCGPRSAASVLPSATVETKGC
jgi:hypothetical protein